jgi:hypothetical protein
MDESPDRLQDQLAAAEKTLLALQALLAQSQEMIIATRKVIEETRATQANRDGPTGETKSRSA